MNEQTQQDAHKGLQHVLQPYVQHYLPPAGIGHQFRDSVHELFAGLETLRTTANRTVARESSRDTFTIPRQGLPLQDVIDNVIMRYLGDVPNCSGGVAPYNVAPPPLIPAVLAKMACAIINPNLVSETSGGKALEAEQVAIGHIAEIVGLDPATAGGYFTSGGTASNCWAIRYALEQTFPGCGRMGLSAFPDARPVIIQSMLGHYSLGTAARLLGIGTNNVVHIPADSQMSIDLQALRTRLEDVIQEGRQVVCISLVAGVTDTFGVDDVESVFQIREEICEKYGIARPQIHVDAAVGWIYGIFRDYDTVANPHGFDARTVRSIERLNSLYAGMRYADSITVDLHKQGFVPYSASAVLLKDRRNLALFQKTDDETPYFTEDRARAFPGSYTFETSRAGDGPLMTLANIYALGYEGYQSLIGYAIQQTNALKSAFQGQFDDRIHVVNTDVPGTSTAWRIYPPGVNAHEAYARELYGTTAADRQFTEQINMYNDELFALRRDISDEQTPILGYSQNVLESAAGAPISGWKCILFNPFINITAVMNNVRAVLAQEAKIQSEMLGSLFPAQRRELVPVPVARS